MAVKNLITNNGNFPRKVKLGDFSRILETLSEVKLIDLIVKLSKPQRRNIVRRQIEIYFKKIRLHPEMRGVYIKLVKDLICFEKNKRDRIDE
jgi:hypothetical protein